MRRADVVSALFCLMLLTLSRKRKTHISSSMYNKTYPEPKIIERDAIYIVGMHTEMSLAENTTVQLWQAFGPRQKEIENREDKGCYSIQIYNDDFSTQAFLPTTQFKKWAGVAVVGEIKTPDGLEVLTIEAGKWAVFPYKGTPQNFGNLVYFVMTQWLPRSEYKLDNRPQFEYMDEHYAGPMNPEAQEEFWVPVLTK